MSDMTTEQRLEAAEAERKECEQHYRNLLNQAHSTMARARMLTDPQRKDDELKKGLEHIHILAERFYKQAGGVAIESDNTSEVAALAAERDAARSYIDQLIEDLKARTPALYEQTLKEYQDDALKCRKMQLEAEAERDRLADRERELKDIVYRMHLIARHHATEEEYDQVVDLMLLARPEDKPDTPQA